MFNFKLIYFNKRLSKFQKKYYLLSQPPKIILIFDIIKYWYSYPCFKLKNYQQKPISLFIFSCPLFLDYSEAVSDPSSPTSQNREMLMKLHIRFFLSPRRSAASSPSSAIKLYNGKSQSMLNTKLWLCRLW